MLRMVPLATLKHHPGDGEWGGWMREIRTSGLMSGDEKRATDIRSRTAPVLDSTERSSKKPRSLALTFVSPSVLDQEAAAVAMT